jgi:hypothetical protein
MLWVGNLLLLAVDFSFKDLSRLGDGSIQKTKPLGATDSGQELRLS